MNKLPDYCYVVVKTRNELAIVKKNVRGFFPVDDCVSSGMTGEQLQLLADLYNLKLGLNPAQVEAMHCGSLFGWDAKGANPQTYMDYAVLEETRNVTGHLQDGPLTIMVPIKGNLHRYRIAGKDMYYLEPDALIGVYKNYFPSTGKILLPDLIAGTPLLPVSAPAYFGANGSCSLKLAECIAEKEENANYTICLRMDVGEVQYVLAYSNHSNNGIPAMYATWERTPSNEAKGEPPSYYWGHYFDSCIGGIKDFTARVAEKYAWQKEVGIR